LPAAPISGGPPLSVAEVNLGDSTCVQFALYVPIFHFLIANSRY
jgi:hypothetical protein